MFGRRRPHRHIADDFRAQFRTTYRCARCDPDHGSLHRNHHLLGASRSDRRFSMGRLDASDLGDGDFHRDPKPGRNVLCSANCRKLRRVASDDGDRVDFCLGVDHWRGNRSASCRAADRDSQSPPCTLRLGRTFKARDC